MHSMQQYVTGSGLQLSPDHNVLGKYADSISSENKILTVGINNTYAGIIDISVVCTN